MHGRRSLVHGCAASLDISSPTGQEFSLIGVGSYQLASASLEVWSKAQNKARASLVFHPGLNVHRDALVSTKSRSPRTDCQHRWSD
jgi:hypothetical protein